MIDEGNLVETTDYGWNEVGEEMSYSDAVSVSTVSTNDTEANKNKVKKD